MWGVDGWFKVVLISSPALISMGGFSQEVLKNYFHMTGVTVLNSIWMDQMVICLYSQQQDGFTELTGCITRARDYLAEERKIRWPAVSAALMKHGTADGSLWGGGFLYQGVFRAGGAPCL